MHKALSALLIPLIFLSMLVLGGCSDRERQDTKDIIGSIALGYLIIEDEKLYEQWDDFRKLVREEGLDSAKVVEAAQRLWDTGVKLRPATYPLLKKDETIRSYYSDARQALAVILLKPEPPDLTVEEIDAFLASEAAPPPS